MDIYIDFEATQPEQEIIAVGAYSLQGGSFYSLVKPKFSTPDTYVTRVTGITPEDLESAPSLDTVLLSLFDWVQCQGQGASDLRFLSYGPDLKFLRASYPGLSDTSAMQVANFMLERFVNCQGSISTFFTGRIALKEAYSHFYGDGSTIVAHNPADDAKMLGKVMKSIAGRKPLKQHPYRSRQVMPVDFKLPEGIFTCVRIRTGETFEFSSSAKALDWLSHLCNPGSKGGAVNQYKLMSRIMKSVRTGTPYGEYQWYRVK